MSSRMGRLLSVQLFGESHGPSVGVTLDGLPSGLKLDTEALGAFVLRRAARSHLSTERRESDIPHIISGVSDDVATGQPLTAVFENADADDAAYAFLPDTPRPGHADYPALVRSLFNDDLRGGGHHSGRLTLPYVFAGAVAMQLLQTDGIRIAAHVQQIGPEKDIPLDPLKPDMDALFAAQSQPIATLDANASKRMAACICKTREQSDSLGGVVECAVCGVPAGLGAPFFEGIESVMAAHLFAIPAVKGVEFGAGFAAAGMCGSTYNDPYTLQNQAVATTSNHAGGLLGGLTNGMPIIVRAAFRPTASIAQPQQTVSLSAMAEAELTVTGRHDPCIVPRAVPVVESAVALALADCWLERRATYPLSDRREKL